MVGAENLRPQFPASVHWTPIRIQKALSRAFGVLAVFSMLAPSFSALAAQPSALKGASSPRAAAVRADGSKDGPRSVTRPISAGETRLSAGVAGDAQAPARQPRSGPSGAHGAGVSMQALLVDPTPIPEPGTIVLPETLVIELPGGEAAALQSFGLEALQAGGPGDDFDRPIAAGPADERQPAVAFNSVDVEYLVAWIEGSAPAGLKVQRVNTAGGLVGPVLPMPTVGTGDPFRPLLAHSPADNSYVLLWSQPNGGTRSDTYCADNCITITMNTNDLYVLPLAASGTPLAPAPIPLTTGHTAYSGFRQNFAIAYNSTAAEYLVVWTEPPGIAIGTSYQIVHPHTL